MKLLRVIFLFMLFSGGVVAASTSVYNGSLHVPTEGTIVDVNQSPGTCAYYESPGPELVGQTCPPSASPYPSPLASSPLTVSYNAGQATFACGACATVFNVDSYGAVCDGATDNTTAINDAISAAQAAGGGTIYFPACSEPYVVKEAIAIPWTGPTTAPVQPPLRFTGGGQTQNGYWPSSPVNGGAVINDTATPGPNQIAKIVSYGAGALEIDHLTLEDTGSDNDLFFLDTGSTAYIHDNACIGNPSNSGTANAQDCWRMGGDGYTASSASITASSHTLTIGGSDPPFKSYMVGWTVYLPTGGTAGGALETTISAYTSSTQVSLTAAAGTTVTNGTAYYFGTGADPNGAFQGYGSVIARNYYSHIRAGVIWGTFANNITVEDETYSSTCGSNQTHGAPYVFDNVYGNVVGNIIRGGTIEVLGYPYLVEVLSNDAELNTFDALGGYDDNGTTLGGIYFGANAVYNMVIAGWLDPTLQSAYLAGPGAASNSLIGAGNELAPQLLSLSLASLAVTGGGNAASSTGPWDADSGNSNGLGLRISGTNVLYSDGGGANHNLYLVAPGASSSYLVYFGYNGGATSFGSISSGGYSIGSASYGPTNAVVPGYVSTGSTTSRGQASCTISGTSCSTTATVFSGAYCSASYDHATTVTLADLEPLQVSVSSTTLSLYGDTTTSLSGTIYFDYVCL